jgi:hypothetical protein
MVYESSNIPPNFSPNSLSSNSINQKPKKPFDANSSEEISSPNSFTWSQTSIEGVKKMFSSSGMGAPTDQQCNDFLNQMMKSISSQISHDQEFHKQQEADRKELEDLEGN